jgi:hypothetical protein
VKVIALIISAVVVVIITPIIYLTSTYNQFVRHENGIVAVHEDMQNVHSSVFNQLKSQGLAVEKYQEMVVQAMQVAVEGRYGKSGVQAAVTWIREQNPTIDPSVVRKLQEAIEIGYNKFESAQRTKIDRLRAFDNDLDSAIKGNVARFLGFPKKVTADMRKTITSATTETMMKTKQMDTINPFSK